MEAGTCNQRMAAALEEEFQSCHNLLSGALAGVANRGSFQDWEMRSILCLMRTTAPRWPRSSVSCRGKRQRKISKIAVQFRKKIADEARCLTNAARLRVTPTG